MHLKAQLADKVRSLCVVVVARLLLFCQNFGRDTVSYALASSSLTHALTHSRTPQVDDRGYHPTPVYITKQRGPTYVWTFHLRSKQPSAKWTLSGTALILSN